MKKCPHCGADLTDGTTSFCPACGKETEILENKKSAKKKGKKKSKGGTDAYCNLVLVLEPIHKLIHATEPSIISKYLQILDLSEKQLKKLNYLRTLLNIEKIAT